MIKKSKPKVIALCMAGVRTEYQDVIMNKVCNYAHKMEFKVMVFTSYSELQFSAKHDIGEENIFNLMNFDIIDGMIILSESIKSKEPLMRLVNKGISANVPIISIEREIDGCYNILFDYSGTMKQIVRHFVEYHKFTKINFMAGIKGNDYSEERLNAYKSVLTDNNIPIDERRIGYGDFWATPTYSEMDKFMKTGLDMPEAIVCANDDMAIAVCQKLEEYGYKVPEDVCISGFDGIIEGMYHNPRLTTARQNLDRASEIAIKKLKDIFDGKETAKIEKVDNEFIISQSCGCKKKKSTNTNNYIRKISAEHADFNTFNTNMVRMVSNLSDGISLDECMNKLQDYMHYIDFPKVWICIVENFITDVSAFEEVFSEKDRYTVGYPDKMKLLMYRNGVNIFSGQSFSVKEILPEIQKVFEDEDQILFAPLHFQDMAIGYIGITFEPPVSEFFKFYSFIMNLSNILETIKNHTEMRMLIKRLEEMYVHDPLTGLYNRRGFYNNVNALFDKCKQENKKLVIISLDLDGLKTINDVYGHSEGDNAIKILATALMTSSMKSEICARFGGDEYIVASAAEDADDGSEYINQYIGKIQQYLNNYNRSSKKPYEIKVSYGVVKQIPAKEMSLDGMIKVADALMYKDKFKHKKYRDKLRADKE